MNNKYSIDAELLDDKLTFYGICEFMDRREEIKKLLADKTPNEILLYNWYIHSRPLLNENWRDILWEYLMDDIDEATLNMLYKCYLQKKKVLNCNFEMDE